MLEHSQIVKAISFIYPNAGFAVNDSEIVNWESEKPQPTMAEIEAGWIAYQIKAEADKAEAEAKRQTLLDKLGITEEEARLLLGGKN